LQTPRNLLTRNRLALLRAIRNKRPGSIYELAKIVERDLKNVQDDLRLLEEYGLVKVPRALFGAIALKIAI